MTTLRKTNATQKSLFFLGPKISPNINKNVLLDKIEHAYLFYCSNFVVNPLNANIEKWSNTLKQIVGNLPTICLSVFDHFMNLALKRLIVVF